MSSQKPDKGATLAAKVEALESKMARLEFIFAREIKNEEFRRSENVRKAREEQQWKDALPERLESLRAFLDKCCTLGKGRSTFQGFIVKAYHEFCRDSGADCRMPTNQEVARAEMAARKGGDRGYKYPEREPVVPLGRELCLTVAELDTAILDLSGVEESTGKNRHGYSDATYTGLCLKNAFKYENCEPEPERDGVIVSDPNRAWVPVG